MKKILFIAFLLLSVISKAQYVADGVRIIPTYGTSVSMDTTGIANALTSSATAGWQSDRVDNTSTQAINYLVTVSLQIKVGAPANDKAVYVYAVPWYYDGSTWYTSDGGTGTLPSGSKGTYTMASPNNLTLLGVMNYTTSGQKVQKNFSLSNAFGSTMPHGWSLFINNYSGVADSTINVIKYVPVQ